jgi:hypothetical protein
MRYVIVIAALAAFLLWDALNNHGKYLDALVHEGRHILHVVGL